MCGSNNGEILTVGFHNNLGDLVQIFPAFWQEILDFDEDNGHIDQCFVWVPYASSCCCASLNNQFGCVSDNKFNSVIIDKGLIPLCQATSNHREIERAFTNRIKLSAPGLLVFVFVGSARGKLHRAKVSNYTSKKRGLGISV